MLSACTAAVRIPRQPFTDIPVPARVGAVLTRLGDHGDADRHDGQARLLRPDLRWTRHSRQARQLLIQNGWTETKSERFVNPEKFPGVWAEFSKGDDTCRVTAIEGAQATHVDYTVARVTRPR